MIDSLLSGSVVVSGREWILPAAIALVVAAVLVWFNYRRVDGVHGWKWACMGLKFLGLLILFACLLEPLWSTRRAEPGANWFAVVVDNSRSMQLHDEGDAVSRGERVRDRLIAAEDSWLKDLGATFQVRRYSFSGRLQPMRTFGEANFEGDASSLFGSLAAVQRRFEGQPLGGVLLFTDGNATDLPTGTPQLEGMPPVYPVRIGSDALVDDVSLARVNVSQTAFEDAPVTIEADVRAEGYSGRRLIGTLESLESSTVATNTIPERLRLDRELGDGDTRTVFRFEPRPTGAGVHFYRLNVEVDPGLSGTPAAEEATLVNNRRLVAVDRGKGPYRVLYVAGRPNWEYKFLKRALAEDDQVHLTGLIRLALREPKFEFKGRAGETSNPLFRGFGRNSEEAARYDEPVFVRLDVMEPNELLGGFPKSEAELFQYHAVILDDLESAFFRPGQMALLQRFVAERGGGFLMLGGQESFQGGEYDRTEIGDLLPVYLHDGPAASVAPPRQGYKLELTREGWLEPWTRLKNSEPLERARLEDIPPFQVLNQVRQVKPGASTLGIVRSRDGEELPALVAQRYGLGRSAALMIGDFWRSGRRTPEQAEDQAKAWRQITRWLIADVPEQLEMSASPDEEALVPSIRLSVKARDESFQPLENAQVRLTITNLARLTTTNDGPASTAITLALDESESKPGMYEASYYPREPGAYLAKAVVLDANGNEVGRVETGWTSEPAADEFRSLNPNNAVLDLIARQTGGEVLALGDLASFSRSLPEREVPVMETHTRPLWHEPWVFIAALLCFVAEWGVRRWKGLA